jgi:polysaccharide deacetylase family protein (PEP-CTERM system associated)
VQSNGIPNILSIDLEEWDQLAYRRFTGEFPPPSRNIFRQVDSLLEVLDRAKVSATFFVLGHLAERHPDIVKMLASRGHEIASHGHGHFIVDRLSPKEFREDTLRSKTFLENITGTRVAGYRAAEFSIRQSSLWALEILAELGFNYDSSIFPIRHRRYGIPAFSRQVASYLLPNGLSIAEFPLSSFEVAGFRLPIAGGGSFRMAPQRLLTGAVKKLNDDQVPFITYFHPYEFDPERLDVFAAAPARDWKQRLQFLQFNFHQNLKRRTLPAKISKLLRNFEFTTFREYLRRVSLSDSTTLLPTAGH